MMPYLPEHLRLCTLKTQLQLPIGNLLDSWGLGKDYSDYGKATSITGRTNSYFCLRGNDMNKTQVHVMGGIFVYVLPILIYLGGMIPEFASEKKLQRAPLVPGPRPRHVKGISWDAVSVVVQCLFSSINNMHKSTLWEVQTLKYGPWCVSISTFS